MKTQTSTRAVLATPIVVLMALAATTLAAQDTGGGEPVPVTVNNFNRAESDLYFGKSVKAGAFGKLSHEREMAPIDKQIVVRMNRDTIYSGGVFDLEAGPVTVILPDTGKRFMSLQAVSEDHYTSEVYYAPGGHTYTKESVGTRYVFFIIRTLANPEDPADMKQAHDLQDAIKVEQASVGKWEEPNWDPVSQNKVRDALKVLGSTLAAATTMAKVPTGTGSGNMFGTKQEVDPVLHLIGTAIVWGGNPRAAAVYQSVYPKQNDGKTAYRLTVKDVPVDGFWSISVYNAKGYFEKNALNAYTFNNLTAKPNPDGSVTIQFGGNPKDSPNYLPIMPGWNYTVRLYRPRKAILDGTWQFPGAQVAPGAAIAQSGPATATPATAAGDQPIPVTVNNFNRAESDLFFGKSVKGGAFGKLNRDREMASIDKQGIVRMNRDTLYSTGVFDLEAGPVTVTLPEPRKRFISMLAVSEDQYAVEIGYAPGSYTLMYGKYKNPFLPMTGWFLQAGVQLASPLLL